MTIFNLAGEPTSRPTFIQQPSRVIKYNNDEDDDEYASHTSTKLPQINFPTTNYDQSPSGRELSTPKADNTLQEDKCQMWISASIKRQSRSRSIKNKSCTKKIKSLHVNNIDNSAKYSLSKETHSLRLTTRVNVPQLHAINVNSDLKKVPNTKDDKNLKQTLHVVAKQQPLHLTN